MSTDLTESQVTACLDNAGLKWQDRGRYIVSQCPFHDDRNPSAQIFKNDWFVGCNAGCDRQHISKAFPELSGGRVTSPHSQSGRPHQLNKNRGPEVLKTAHKKYNLYDAWREMKLIPRDHRFKGIPLEVLDGLGWRWTDGVAGMRAGYFIPYWNPTRTTITFAQVRHLSGERRFTFLPDADLTVYGKWNLDNPVIFVVEGSSDGAVLEYCGVPWVALPSASSTMLIKQMAEYCKKEGVRLVYAGDKDAAGDHLKWALNEVASYRLRQPPKEYKDWGEFFEAEGQTAVLGYCQPEIGKIAPPTTTVKSDVKSENRIMVLTDLSIIDRIPDATLDDLPVDAPGWLIEAVMA